MSELGEKLLMLDIEQLETHVESLETEVTRLRAELETRDWEIGDLKDELDYVRGWCVSSRAEKYELREENKRLKALANPETPALGWRVYPE
jgi:predicted RNase H-like nuclease (RuvC/YqgF family)